ncbi:MAG: DUF4115 domain-containing protein [Candidatus Doudnabacteria bacterium]|nr:DUF4115 domain-containing protein [Candidatus Doudnabacteria bacterium]
MSFITKKVKTESLGEYLQVLRKRTGLPVSEISKVSQVQPRYLQALEEGRFQDLPAAVYIKGFLKSLAAVYRIDVNILLNQFAAEHEIAHNVETLKKPVPKLPITIPRFVLNPKTLTIAAVALLGFLSLGYLYFQISSLNRPPKLEVFSPERDVAVNSSLLLVKGETEPGSSVFLNNQPIVADANGEFRENLSLAPGPNQLVIKAINKFGQESAVSRSIVLNEKEIAGSSTVGSPLAAGLNLEVVIGEQATWIYLEADGIEKYSGTMLPNSRQTIKASDKIVLTTGNAGNTRVILDGKDLGTLGKEGEVVKDIEFTPTP